MRAYWIIVADGVMALLQASHTRVYKPAQRIAFNVLKSQTYRIRSMVEQQLALSLAWGGWRTAFHSCLGCQGLSQPLLPVSRFPEYGLLAI